MNKIKIYNIKSYISKIISLCLFITIMIMFVGCSSTNISSSSNTINESTVYNGISQTTEKTDNSIETDSTSEQINTSGDTNASQSPTVTGTMQVHFIDVGQADCILVNADSHYMLIDSGNSADYSMVSNYLASQGVQSLDYVIFTHPHEDHEGCAADIVNSYNINTIIMNDKVNNTQFYNNLLTAISNKGLTITLPVIGNTYNLGSATFTIISPNDDYSNNLNNSSVGIKLVYGTKSFVMCGDAEIESEYDIIENGIDINADVLKCGHHGSDSSTCEAFIKAINPTYAVISVGSLNIYGHPALQTLNRLNQYGIQTFRTDEQGSIIATTDGFTLSFNTSPSTSMLPGTNNNSGTTVYLTKSGSKYHTEGCQYLKKSSIPISLEDAKIQGYTPCSQCNPPQ